MNRTCPACRRSLDEADFNFKDRAIGRRQSHCRDCTRAQVRAHYAENTPYYLEKTRLRNIAERTSLLERLLAHLRAHPCVDCGETDPVVLDFDHVDRTDKTSEVAVLVRRRLAWRIIRDEIARC